MQHLCAPWRSEYFSAKKDSCVFCDVINSDDDDKNGVLFRAKHCFGIMNLYPYSPGHFMIIPNQHTDKIEELDEQTWFEMSKFVRLGVEILKKELYAIGMNLGKAAGAGIAEHVHYHLVPRWSGDTNFITTISDVRVNGTPFHPLFEQLKKAFSAVI